MAGALIVGAGLGALRTAEGLRASGWHGLITVVGEEQLPPYNRPPLTKGALTDGATDEDLLFRQRSSLADVVWRLGEQVVSVDVDDRSATTARGEVLTYEALVLATGVNARRLPSPAPAPYAASGRHVVRTLDDSRALRASLARGSRVVVLGAGFIGCEVASSARALGADVTCVALDEHPMVRPLGSALGDELRRRHEAQGVTFRLGIGVSHLVGEERVSGVVLTDGTHLPADVVVEALGSTCNVGMLVGQGFDLTDRVLTDGALRPVRNGIPVDGMAVVGDLARFPNPRFDDRAHRVEHWSVPTDTGRRAGAVLGAYLLDKGYEDAVNAPFECLPEFWSTQYDTRIQSFGMPGLADPGGVRLLEGAIDSECVVGYHRGDVLAGVVGLGMARAVNAYARTVGRPGWGSGS